MVRTAIYTQSLNTDNRAGNVCILPNLETMREWRAVIVRAASNFYRFARFYLYFRATPPVLKLSIYTLSAIKNKEM
tara:strand:- start:2141 stop:2368 length:228 start_codon:yes stop_codon:yes gene_type:complete